MGLFDNIVDEKALREQLVVPVLQQIAEQTIPALRNALDESVDRAIGQISNVLRGETIGLQAVTDKIVHDLDALLARQDGWTVEIEVPRVVIRLRKPGAASVEGVIDPRKERFEAYVARVGRKGTNDGSLPPKWEELTEEMKNIWADKASADEKG